jgi:putative transposase
MQLKKDQTIYMDAVEYRVVRRIDDKVQLEQQPGGQLSTPSLWSLMDAWVSGRLLTHAEHRKRKGEYQSGKLPPRRMDELSPAGRAETRRRLEILWALEREGSFHKPRSALIEDLKKIAHVRGEHRPIHATTVYRWRRKLSEFNDVRDVFAWVGERGGKDGSRLHPAVEGLLLEALDESWTAGKAATAELIHEALQLKVKAENARRVESDQLPVPSTRTVQRRVSQLGNQVVTRALVGREEADRRFALMGRARVTSRILELVEIDHTPVDLLITDAFGRVCSRPWLTAVICRFSRAILGYCLSASGHGTQQVFEAIRHAIMPKTYLKRRFPDLDLDWPMYGWMELIVADNGRELHAEALRDALLNLAIQLEFARPRTPNDKPHIERFLRTFNYTFIHRLPGTTRARVKDRVGIEPLKEACMTLEQLDQAIHVWICMKYHQRPHAGLNGRTPLAVWTESAAVHEPQLKASASELEIEFSDIDERVLQHHGIEINGFQYSNARLSGIRAMLPKGAKAKVKAPLHDVGHIWVWDKIDEEYVRVDNKDREFVGMGLEQAKAVIKAKAALDRPPGLELATAQQVLNGLVEEAQAHQKLKVRKQAQRLAKQDSRLLREDPRRLYQAEPESTAAFTADDEEVQAFDVDHAAVEVDR